MAGRPWGRPVFLAAHALNPTPRADASRAGMKRASTMETTLVRRVRRRAAWSGHATPALRRRAQANPTARTAGVSVAGAGTTPTNFVTRPKVSTVTRPLRM